MCCLGTGLGLGHRAHRDHLDHPIAAPKANLPNTCLLSCPTKRCTNECKLLVSLVPIKSPAKIWWVDPRGLAGAQKVVWVSSYRFAPV